MLYAEHSGCTALNTDSTMHMDGKFGLGITWSSSSQTNYASRVFPTTNSLAHEVECCHRMFW